MNDTVKVELSIKVFISIYKKVSNLDNKFHKNDLRATRYTPLWPTYMTYSEITRQTNFQFSIFQLRIKRQIYSFFLKPKLTYSSIVDNNVKSVVFWITKNIESFSFIHSIVRHILKKERRFDSLNFMTLKYDTCNSNHTTL